MLDLLFPEPPPERPTRAPHTWGWLVPINPFAAVFPDGKVPLKSILPVIPRERTAPPCYLLDVAQISDAQIAALAALLWQQWQPECASAAEAEAYIRQEGLPIRVSWFSGVGTRQITLFV